MSQAEKPTTPILSRRALTVGIAAAGLAAGTASALATFGLATLGLMLRPRRRG